MSESRKNLKVNPDAYQRLKQAKDPEQSWSEFLLDLLKGAPVQAETVELSEEERDMIARQTADEVEARLRNKH